MAVDKSVPVACRRAVAAFAVRAIGLARLCGFAALAVAACGHAEPSAEPASGSPPGTAQARSPAAGPLRVAVAANFRAAANQLAEQFEQRHGVVLSLTFGSSGLLAAQIRQGAPFDAFFSADTMRPAALVDQGLATGPVTVYARGRVALRTTGIDSGTANAGAQRIGIPNPQLAPYGAAAVQCLQRLGVWRQVQDRLVFGNNVNQVDHFLETGALHRGFVALSQLVAKETAPGRYWVCPGSFHAPIDQGAVILARSRYPAAARTLLQFLTRPATQKQLARLGYVGND